MRRHYGNAAGCLALAAALLLAACASTGPAPVEDLSIGSRAPRANAAPRAEAKPANRVEGYRVQRGDTLYSIAFRNGVDYRELAGWNGIHPPYTIYVGQELRVGAPARASSATAAAAAQPARPPAGVAAAPVTAAKPPSTADGIPRPAPFGAVEPGSSSVSTTTTMTTASTAPASAAVVPVATAPAAATTAKPAATPPAPLPPPASAPATSGEVAWRWPADGQLVGAFVGGDQTRQGIDIAGKAGDPVRAAADGSVVYSGNGLIGYGELIIVKHSPSFLSAYGHNRKRLVKEGDKVKSGQVIAEMGSSSASRDSLHFEIRKNGKPANPIDYLPRR